MDSATKKELLAKYSFPPHIQAVINERWKHRKKLTKEEELKKATETWERIMNPQGA